MDGTTLAMNFYPNDGNAPKYPDAKRPTTYIEGMEFEDFVREKCSEIGLILQRFSSAKYQYEHGDGRIDEIKLDARMRDRLSIEIAEKSKASNRLFVPSGIYAKGDFFLYIQGNYDIIFIFARNFLQRLHKYGDYDKGETPTLKSFYLPLPHAFKYAITVICINEKGKLLEKQFGNDFEE